MLRSKKKSRSTSSNVFSQFDQQQIGEFKEAFSLLDQNADGIVTREDLKELLVSLGKPATVADLDEMMADIPREAPGMNFTLFLTLMGEKLQDIDAESDLLAAFEVLDETRSGFISTELLRQHLMGSGEPPLSEEEFELMLRGAQLNAQGHLNYRHFVKALTHAHEEEV